MKPDSSRQKQRQKASTLLAVYWVIAVLSLAVMTCVSFVLTDVKFGVSGNQSFDARNWAEKGIAIAANPLVKPWDEILRYRDENGGGYEVSIISEGARFNLNAIIANQDEDLMQRIFTEWGLDLEKSQALSHAMMDWVDGDSLERLNGAEQEFYEEQGYFNQPFNRPFSSLEEIRLVAGMVEVDAIFPYWRDYFSLWSAGRLDVNEAEPQLIALACQCTIDSAENWVQIRRGEDGIENTEDDRQVLSTTELLPLLQVGPDLEPQLVRRISFQDPTARIVSSGFAGDRTYRRSIVLRRDGAAPSLLFINDEAF